MNILFIGMGSIGKKHYHLFRKMYPSFSFYALKRGFQEQTDKNLKYLYGWEEVKSIGFDAAVICNPTSEHLKYSLLCANKGINLFIEKPISDGMRGLGELIQQARENDIKTMVGYNLRFHPVVEKAKRFVEESDDRVVSFSAYSGSYLPDWRCGDYRLYYSGFKEQGGGVILDLSHEIDYCKWLFGSPKKVISAYGNHSSLEIDTEDIAEIIFDYDDKIGSIHLDYCRVISKRELEIITDRFLFQGNLLTGAWSIVGNNSEEKGEFVLDSELTYRKQLKHFVSMLSSKEEPCCDLEDAIETMQIIMEVKGEVF